MDEEIPAALLAKHPALEAVAEALKQYHAGSPVTARCIRCEATLEVVDMPETGLLVVQCPNGDTYFRARRAKKSADTR